MHSTCFRTMVRKVVIPSQIFTRLPPLVLLVSFFTRLSHLFPLVLLSMDKSWMNFPRTTCTYLDGLEVFLNFAIIHGADCYGNIICPCPKCNLRKWQPRQTVKEHLVLRAFPKDYIFWHLHGEKYDMVYDSLGESSYVRKVQLAGSDDDDNDDDPIVDAIHDAFGVHGLDENLEEVGAESVPNMSDTTCDKFKELMEESDKPLYPNCKRYSKLSFLARFYHIKCLHNMSDVGISMILELLHDAFPEAEITPSFYEAKILIRKFGLDCEKIDVCPNDCMLYWGEDAERDKCKCCPLSRYKKMLEGKKKQSAKIL